MKATNAQRAGAPVRPCVVVAERCPSAEPPIASLLAAEQHDIVPCEADRDILEQIIQRRPQALVYAFDTRCEGDLALLFLLRRVAPAVPLILVAAAASLETQKAIQELRPTYYVVRPVDGVELREAVEAALARRARR